MKEREQDERDVSELEAELVSLRALLQQESPDPIRVRVRVRVRVCCNRRALIPRSRALIPTLTHDQTEKTTPR